MTILNWNDVLQFTQKGNPPHDRRVEKTNKEWRAQLNDTQYFVTREHSTEARFSGALCESYEPGLYACVCCGEPLFDSSEKFDSGTGWPSFTQPTNAQAVQYQADNAYGMVRVEVLCNVCDAHLGHVFPDGPSPSGLRFCINSTSLEKL